jgi:hypothetical protein
LKIVSGAYRAAVWVARLSYVWALAWLVTAWVIRPPGRAVFLLWFTGVPFAVGVPVLVRRVGVPYFRRSGPFGLLWGIDRETGRRFYRDVFWPSRQP